MTLSIVLFLISIGFAAGFIDAIAGGGGLITIPSLLWAGLPPHLALGTNKLQSSLGTLWACRQYLKNGEVRLQDCLWGIIPTFLGAVWGVLAIQSIDIRFLNKLIPGLLMAIGAFTLFFPSLGREDRPSRFSLKTILMSFGLLLGFYDGFFGPGTGSFWAIALVVLGGMNLRKATATTKVMNLTSNVVSVVIFAFYGSVSLSFGLTMAVGQIMGAHLGAKMVIGRGVSFIRPIFVTMVFVTAISLLLK